MDGRDRKKERKKEKKKKEKKKEGRKEREQNIQKTESIERKPHKHERVREVLSAILAICR